MLIISDEGLAASNSEETKRGKKRKAKDGGGSERKKKSKKKKKGKNDSLDDDGIDGGNSGPGTPVTPAQGMDSGDFGATPDIESANDTPKQPRRKARTKASELGKLKSSEELCAEYGLVNPSIEYTDEDYALLKNRKAFEEYIRPIISEQNPKIPLHKLVDVVGAKWREFIASNPNNKEKGALSVDCSGSTSGSSRPARAAKTAAAAAAQAAGDEGDAEAQMAVEENENANSAKKRRSNTIKKGKTVAPLKIKLSKKKKKKKTSSDEEIVPGGFDTSDEEFERQLEEAAILEQVRLIFIDFIEYIILIL